MQLRQLPRTDQIPHCRLRLHNVGRDPAGIDQRVMDARGRGHVLAHIVHADIHQLDRVQRAAPQMRRRRRMRRPAVEREINLVAGERNRRVHRRDRRRMPGNRDIHILEQPGPHHEPLGRAAFLRRAPVIAHAPFDSRCRQIILHRRRREHRRRPQQIMPARMPVPALLERALLRHAGLLAQPRQRIELAENSDHRAVLARLADHRRRQSPRIPRHPEPLLLQHRRMLRRGPVFVVVQLRHPPDTVTQREEILTLGFDQGPGFVCVAHAPLQVIRLGCAGFVPKSRTGTLNPGSGQQIVQAEGAFLRRRQRRLAVNHARHRSQCFPMEPGNVDPRPHRRWRRSKRMRRVACSLMGSG